jgi:phosphoribosyl 1,2-cyclic phosphodiesterase
MNILFHGVRGSTPTAHENFLKYGGSTTCTEILHDEFQIIFDAGTGFQDVSIKKDRPTYLMFSHFHYDHIQGLPFNYEIFDPSNKVTICSGLVPSVQLREIFVRAFQPLYFPIPLVETLKNLKFVDFAEVQREISNLCVLNTIKLNHPGGAAGYVVEKNSRKICCYLDHEYGQDELIDNDLVEKAANADLIIWDGMFLDEELPPKKGWGHSSIEQGVKFSEVVNCRGLAITHHSPSRNDHQLTEHSNNLNSDKVFFAYQGLCHSI